jgi:hypothetical protein
VRRNLLSVLAIKIAQLVPPAYHTPPSVTSVAPDPCPGLLSPIDLNIALEGRFETWRLTLSQKLVMCPDSPTLRACHPLPQYICGLAGDLFPLIMLSTWDISDSAARSSPHSALRRDAKVHDATLDPIVLLTTGMEVLGPVCHCLFEPVTAGELVWRCGHPFRAARFYQLASRWSAEIGFRVIAIVRHLHRRESALGIFATFGL